MLSVEWGETPESMGHGSTTPAPAVFYYRRVADDDPVNDQLIEFTFRQPKVNDSGAIDSYIVQDPVNTDQPLHEILPIDQKDGQDNVTQEGFSGKDAVLGRLKGYLIPEGRYNLELRTKAGNRYSVPASVRLIIDSNQTAE